MRRELGALSLSTLTDQEKNDLADAMRPLYMGTNALLVLETIKANAYAAGLAAGLAAGRQEAAPEEWTCGGCGAVASPGTEGWSHTDAAWCPKCAWLR